MGNIAIYTTEDLIDKVELKLSIFHPLVTFIKRVIAEMVHHRLNIIIIFNQTYEFITMRQNAPCDSQQTFPILWHIIEKMFAYGALLQWLHCPIVYKYYVYTSDSKDAENKIRLDFLLIY